MTSETAILAIGWAEWGRVMQRVGRCLGSRVTQEAERSVGLCLDPFLEGLAFSANLPATGDRVVSYK